VRTSAKDYLEPITSRGSGGSSAPFDIETKDGEPARRAHGDPSAPGFTVRSSPLLRNPNGGSNKEFRNEPHSSKGPAEEHVLPAAASAKLSPSSSRSATETSLLRSQRGSFDCSSPRLAPRSPRRVPLFRHFRSKPRSMLSLGATESPKILRNRWSHLGQAYRSSHRIGTRTRGRCRVLSARRTEAEPFVEVPNGRVPRTASRLMLRVNSQRFGWSLGEFRWSRP